MTSSSLTERASGWVYAASVARVRPMVVKWGTLTVELLHELCQARAALSSRYHRDGANAPSWADYCGEVGLLKSTVNRWLQRYDDETRTVKELPEPAPVRVPPSERLEPEEPRQTIVEADPPEPPPAECTGRRTKLDPVRQARVDEFKARIARQDKQSRGEKPDSSSAGRQEREDLLRRADEQIAQLQEAAERFSHLTLSGGADDAMQSGMLGLVRRYVLSFQPVERQVEVAHNLIKGLRMLIHGLNGEEASA